MRVTIDTNEALSFELVEPGPYGIKVLSISDPQKGEKSTYVTVEFGFADPEVDRLAGHMWRNYPIDGKGAGFFREFWKAATGEDIPMNARIDVDTDDAIGRELVANVVHEEYENRKRNAPGSLVAAA